MDEHKENICNCNTCEYNEVIRCGKNFCILPRCIKEGGGSAAQSKENNRGRLDTD